LPPAHPARDSGRAGSGPGTARYGGERRAHRPGREQLVRSCPVFTICPRIAPGIGQGLVRLAAPKAQFSAIVRELGIFLAVSAIVSPAQPGMLRSCNSSVAVLNPSIRGPRVLPTRWVSVFRLDGEPRPVFSQHPTYGLGFAVSAYRSGPDRVSDSETPEEPDGRDTAKHPGPAHDLRRCTRRGRLERLCLPGAQRSPQSAAGN